MPVFGYVHHVPSLQQYSCLGEGVADRCHFGGLMVGAVLSITGFLEALGERSLSLCPGARPSVSTQTPQSPKPREVCRPPVVLTGSDGDPNATALSVGNSWGGTRVLAQLPLLVPERQRRGSSRKGKWLRSGHSAR